MKADGFRGPFGSGFVTPEVYYRFPSVLSQFKQVDRIVIAHDGRPSSPLLYDAFIQGARAAGIQVYTADILPTPIVSKWANECDCMGFMVTASHNPVSDNGLKILRPKDHLNSEQIHILLSRLSNPIGVSQSSAVTGIQHEIIDAYLGWLGKPKLPKMNCLVDTAQGAWFHHLSILEYLGLSVTNFHDQWQPESINQTGSLFINQLSSSSYDYVIAFDGDGDRLQLMQKNELIDGDDMLYHLSFLQPEPIVGTVLSNQALASSLSQRNIGFIRTDVGDRHVYQQLVQAGGIWGGEPCGHIINRDWLNTSDPIYTLLSLMKSMPINVLPNKHFQWHHDFPESEEIERLKQQLIHPDIRHVIRASQTEPKVRVMLEGPKDLVNRLVAKLSM